MGKLRASKKEDWENYYSQRNKSDEFSPIDINDFRNRPYRKLLEEIIKYIKILEEENNHIKILELGAGDSNILIDISKKFPRFTIVGLDYLETACSLLTKKAKQQNVSLNVICADMFNPPVDLKHSFHFVMSFGLVEHFHDLNYVIGAKKEFVIDTGIIFTLIPNLKNSIYGWLMRKWNKKVYQAHVMYDLNDLANAYKYNDIEILEAKYFLSTNFGMLSWCFNEGKKEINFWIYKQLTRLSKAFWYFEDKLKELPSTRFLSPYIICVGKVRR